MDGECVKVAMVIPTDIAVAVLTKCFYVYYPSELFVMAQILTRSILLEHVCIAILA